MLKSESIASPVNKIPWGIIEQVKQMKLDEARQKGRKEEKLQVVKRLLARHFPIKDISELAGVSIAFVEKLKKTAK